MSNFINQLFEYAFSTSHNNNEFMHFILLILLSFIAKTYWDSSRDSILSMKEDHDLIYGTTIEEDMIGNYDPSKFDEILEKYE